MPNCFQLYKKGEDSPSDLVVVDNEMCAHFGASPDPVRYFEAWFDIIGFRLATGYSFVDMRVEFAKDARLVEIVDWLDQHYSPNAFYQCK